MELDANKIMEGVLARVGAKKSTLLDFNPGPSRHFLEAWLWITLASLVIQKVGIYIMIK